MKYSLFYSALLAMSFVIVACDDGSSSSVTQSEVEGVLTDSRDGQVYKTVVIGSQTWMAQNLNYDIAPNMVAFIHGMLQKLLVLADGTCQQKQNLKLYSPPSVANQQQA